MWCYLSLFVSGSAACRWYINEDLHDIRDFRNSGVASEIKPKSQRVLFKDGLADTDDGQLLGPTDGELVDSTGEGLVMQRDPAGKDNLPQLDIVAEKAGPALIDQTPNAKRSLLLLHLSVSLLLKLEDYCTHFTFLFPLSVAFRSEPSLPTTLSGSTGKRGRKKEALPIVRLYLQFPCLSLGSQALIVKLTWLLLSDSGCYYSHIAVHPDYQAAWI